MSCNSTSKMFREFGLKKAPIADVCDVAEEKPLDSPQLTYAASAQPSMSNAVSNILGAFSSKKHSPME